MSTSRHRIWVLLKWGIALCLLGGVSYCLMNAPWNHLQDGQNADESSRIADIVGSNRTIELDEDAAERLGIVVQAAREMKWKHTVRVYGRVVHNPLATTEIRAVAAGRLIAEETKWPTLGQTILSEEVLGYLQVRVGPDIRLELQNKLSEARLRRQGEEDVVKVHSRTVESLKKVTQREILARAELDTAEVNLAEAQIQLASAESAVKLWERSLQEIDDLSLDGKTLWRLPILCPRIGNVVELPVKPGMEVESGGLLMRLVDFHRPLVRLDVPVESLVNTAPPSAIEIEIPVPVTSDLRGVSNSLQSVNHFPKVQGRFLGPASSVDVSSQRAGMWYEAELPTVPEKSIEGWQTAWKPGLQVQAELPLGQERTPAAVIPASAVLFHEGRSLAYVKTSPEHYERREVRLLQREGNDWIVAMSQPDVPGGIVSGDAVVCRQAQVLLSREFLLSGGDTD